MRASLWIVTSLTLLGCGRKVPANVKPALEAQRAAAIKVAESAGALCPAQKAAPSHPPSPAKGTSLESETKVVDVFVMCNWPSARDPSMSEGTGLPSLRGTSTVPTRAVTMPDDIAETTCKKDPRDCVRVVTPSRHVKSEQSADLYVAKPIAGGGWVEVTVAFADPEK